MSRWNDLLAWVLSTGWPAESSGRAVPLRVALLSVFGGVATAIWLEHSWQHAFGTGFPHWVVDAGFPGRVGKGAAGLCSRLLGASTAGPSNTPLFRGDQRVGIRVGGGSGVHARYVNLLLFERCQHLGPNRGQRRARPPDMQGVDRGKALEAPRSLMLSTPRAAAGNHCSIGCIFLSKRSSLQESQGDSDVRQGGDPPWSGPSLGRLGPSLGRDFSATVDQGSEVTRMCFSRSIGRWTNYSVTSSPR
jgi:hypothetical protein